MNHDDLHAMLTGMAMQALLGRAGVPGAAAPNPDMIAAQAHRYADAMLTHREKLATTYPGYPDVRPAPLTPKVD